VDKREKLEAAVKPEAAVKLEAVAIIPLEDVVHVKMLAATGGMVEPTAVLGGAVAIEREERWRR